jgi:hypothetical protein
MNRHSMGNDETDSAESPCAQVGSVLIAGESHAVRGQVDSISSRHGADADRMPQDIEIAHAR